MSKDDELDSYERAQVMAKRPLCPPDKLIAEYVERQGRKSPPLPEGYELDGRPNDTRQELRVENLGVRLPWDKSPSECCDEMTKLAQESGQYDEPDSSEIGPNSLTIYHTGPIKITTGEVTTTIEWGGE